ncbi:MAG TPA: hypothetical protein VMG12_23205, partial [Polyangiaceae bacterium]|nr:hypothetical protein [Polyangiaceae bacterium]
TPALPRVGVPPGFVPDFRTSGFYVLAAYRLPWLNLMPFAVGELYDAGYELPDSKAISTGLNVRPTPRVVLKGQWTHVWLSGSPTLGDDELDVLELQAAWSF